MMLSFIIMETNCSVLLFLDIYMKEKTSCSIFYSLIL